MRDLTPSQKGALAEAAIATAAIEQGYTVLRPLCEGRRYDLVIDLEPRLLRVQCKLGRLAAGVVRVALRTSRLTPSGYRRTTYTAEEVDAIGVHAAELGTSYLLPIAEACGLRALHLRVEPARNGQRTGITWAHDYELPAVLARMRTAMRDG
jgi:PD-(D/E)XK endonuclease